MAWDATKPLVTTRIKTSPASFIGNWHAIEDWTDSDHESLADATSGAHTPGEVSVLMVGANAEILALTDVPCALAFDTDSYLFLANYGGATSWESIGGPVESGTRMLFYQDAAPIGWTIYEYPDGYLVYISRGSVAGGQAGGTIPAGGFSYSFPSRFYGTSEECQMTIAQMGQHNHTIDTFNLTISSATYEAGAYVSASGPMFYGIVGAYANTNETGGSGAHTHSWSTSLTHLGTWRPPMYNCIMCTKD